MCHMACFTCHLSHVTCHMSHVTCLVGVWCFFVFFYKVVELQRGGFVINRAYHGQFYLKYRLKYGLPLGRKQDHSNLLSSNLTLLTVLTCGVHKQPVWWAEPVWLPSLTIMSGMSGIAANTWKQFTIVKRRPIVTAGMKCKQTLPHYFHTPGPPNPPTQPTPQAPYPFTSV